MSEKKWFLRTQDETFGPETEEQLVAWARLGRVQPGQEISDDEVIWHRVEEVPFLDMRFSIDIGDGNPRGPFNKAAADALLASGRLPPTASIVEVRGPFEEEKTTDAAVAVPHDGDAAGTSAVQVVEKIVEKEVRVEVPVEKIVEKVVEVEKIVEVPPPARTELVVAEVVEPEAAVPPPTAAGSIFGGIGRDRLAALEAAARQELASARAGKHPFNLFRRKS